MKTLFVTYTTLAGANLQVDVALNAAEAASDGCNELAAQRAWNSMTVEQREITNPFVPPHVTSAALISPVATP